jgi:hypothetical protein
MVREEWCSRSATAHCSVDSYTRRDDRGTEFCTFDFSPTSFPIVMNDGNSVPQSGQSLGHYTFTRDGSKGYGINMGVYTYETPSYDVVCPRSTSQSVINLLGVPWLDEVVTHLDPETDTTTVSIRMINEEEGLTLTIDYSWTLTKKY